MNSSENSLQSAFLRFKERKKKLLQQAQAEEETRHRHSLLQDYDSLSPLDLRRRFFDCDEEERARRNTLRIKFVEHVGTLLLKRIRTIPFICPLHKLSPKLVRKLVLLFFVLLRL
eukprot:Rmarinus@m.9250